MNANNTMTKSEESIFFILDGISLYYGFTWYTTKVGILINSGTEYWLLKLHKNGRTIRKLMHQNHGRTGKQVSLPCNVTEIDNATVQHCFHNQKFSETDLKKAMKYIYYHGNARKKLDAKRRLLLQSAFF